MKKVSTVAAKPSKKISQQKLTVGLDLGDRNSWYCVLDECGQIQLEQRVRTNAPVGERRSVRTFAQRQPNDLGRSRLKTKPFPEEKKTKAQSRVPVTALIAWPRFHSPRAEPQGAKQMAAPAETRTPNMHRANQSLLESANGSIATATRQEEKNLSKEKTKEPT